MGGGGGAEGRPLAVQHAQGGAEALATQAACLTFNKAASANAGTLDIGESTDTDGYKDGFAFGVSGACTEFDSMDDFGVYPGSFSRGALSTGQYPHLDDGDIFTIIIKDHASHMASACVILTWMPDSKIGDSHSSPVFNLRAPKWLSPSLSIHQQLIEFFPLILSIIPCAWVSESYLALWSEAPPPLRLSLGKLWAFIVQCRFPDSILATLGALL